MAIARKNLRSGGTTLCRDQLIWECNTSYLCSETGEISVEIPMVIRISDMIGADSSLLELVTSGNVSLRSLQVVILHTRKIASQHSLE
jgi:hypothetical protein